MATVALVHIFNDDANTYVFHALFANKVLAEKYVEKQKELQNLKNAALTRYNEIIAKFPPLEFSEPDPPSPKRWSAGLAEKDITAEMRAERTAAKQLQADHYQRYLDAYKTYYKERDIYVSKIWLEEKQSIPYKSLPGYLYNPEYKVEEIEVRETIE